MSGRPAYLFVVVMMGRGCAVRTCFADFEMDWTFKGHASVSLSDANLRSKMQLQVLEGCFVLLKDIVNQ
jgi:hypothetical protein